MILIDSWECDKTGTRLWLYKTNSSWLESETQEENRIKITGRQLEKQATDWIRQTLHPQTEIEKNEFGKPELVSKLAIYDFTESANLNDRKSAIASNQSDLQQQNVNLPFINFSHSLTDSEIPSQGKDCWVLWGSNSEHQVGVDFERLRPQIEKIKSKFCRPEELEYAHLIKKQSDGSQPESAQPNFSQTEEQLTSPEKLLMIWSAKEAMYKAYGKKEIDFREQMKVHSFELNFDQMIEFTGELWGDKPYNFQLFAKWFKPFVAVWAIESESSH